MNPSSPAIREAVAVERLRESTEEVKRMRAQRDRSLAHQEALRRSLVRSRWVNAAAAAFIMIWFAADLWRIFG